MIQTLRKCVGSGPNCQTSVLTKVRLKQKDWGTNNKGAAWRKRVVLTLPLPLGAGL